MDENFRFALNYLADDTELLFRSARTLRICLAARGRAMRRVREGEITLNTFIRISHQIEEDERKVRDELEARSEFIKTVAVPDVKARYLKAEYAFP